MDIQTHPRIDQALCGAPIALNDGEATVTMKATPQMAADDLGLVHGGFVFGAADYAAMLAVNHPNVVLGKAACAYRAPVAVGDAVLLKATRTAIDGKRHVVRVEGFVRDKLVFEGEFTAYVLDQHVLDR